MGLNTTYARRLDGGDFVGLAECFVADGELRTALPERVLRGRVEIAVGMEGMAEGTTAVTHYVTNHDYELDGEIATGTALFAVVRIADERPGAELFGGRYVDKLRRDQSGWMFVARLILLTWGPFRLHE